MKKILILTPECAPAVSGISTYVERLAKSFLPEDVFVSTSKSVWKIWWMVRKNKIDKLFIHDAWRFRCGACFMQKFFHKPYLIFSHGADIKFASASRYRLYRLSRVAKYAEQVVVDSEFIKSHWLRFLPQLASKITVVYPCPDIDLFTAPSEEELKILRGQYALEGKRVILTVSKLTDGKGIPHLLRIIPEILKSVPNLVWILIGDGPKKKSVIEMIQKNDMQNIVRFLGEVPHKDLKKFYYLAELFVLLTHPDEGKEEGVGMVFLEAAACGLPVVAGKSGGVPEAVHHAETGILVDIYRGDELLIKEIIDLLQNTAYLRQLGEQARLRVQYDFRWENQFAKIKQWL